MRNHETSFENPGARPAVIHAAVYYTTVKQSSADEVERALEV